MDYHFLLDLAIILLCTKLFGVFSKKVKMPQVVGALVAGLILGPALLNAVHESDFIIKLSEVGVIVLMFSAGMEVNIQEIKHCGKSALIIALFGVFLPLIMGFGLAALFNGGFVGMDTKDILQNSFIGVILTATSVGITVETLKEMGKLNSKVGTTILGAAVIDDVLGIVLLTIITSFAGESVNIAIVLLKILGFFVFTAAVGFPFYYLFEKFTGEEKERRRFVLITFAFCLIMSYIAEHFFGVADITGAFMAGVILSNTKQVKFINRRFEILSYMFISPIFFASIGISVEKVELTRTLLLFTVGLLVIALVTKIWGCALGGILCKFNKKDSMRIGYGMVARGEVALIIANKGALMNVVPSEYFGPIIIVVIITTIITPILLKISYNKDLPA